MLNENVRKLVKVACLAVALLLLLGLIIVLVQVIGSNDTVSNYGLTEFSNWWISIFLPILAFSVVATIVSYYLSKKEKKQLQSKYTKIISFTGTKVIQLEKLNNATNKELERSQLSIASHELWRERAIMCNPEIENLVLESFAKEEANNFQKHYPCLDTFQASYMYYSTFVEALCAYNNLSDDAKSFVSLNIEAIRQKLREALLDYIKYAIHRMKEADTSLQGTVEHLADIYAEVNWYENLPLAVKSKIPSTLVTSLMMKKANAEYNSAILSGNVKVEDQVEKLDFFDKFLDWLIPRLSSLWNKFKNHFTRPLEYEYQDEVLDEGENVDISETCDDSADNPLYV